MPADAELSSLLSRRQRINDELEEGKEVKKQYKFVNVYTEFHELSRREIKQYEQTFNRWSIYSSLCHLLCWLRDPCRAIEKYNRCYNRFRARFCPLKVLDFIFNMESRQF